MIQPSSYLNAVTIPTMSLQQSSYQPQPLFKSGIELSELSSSIVQVLTGGNISWDLDRQMNFSIFCNRLVMEMNIPAPVVYTGLKYFQYILASSVNEYNIIDLSDIAHEYSLFTVSLLLAYKFLEDSPPFMSHWSYVSMINIKDLVLLESQVLNILGFSLNISTDQFYQWTEQCNTLYSDMPYISLDQLNTTIDLHMTNSTLGYVTLLPVLLNDIYIVGPAFHCNLSTASSPSQTSPILTTTNDLIDYFMPLSTQQDNIMCNQQTMDDFLLLNNDSTIMYQPPPPLNNNNVQQFNYNDFNYNYDNQLLLLSSLDCCSTNYNQQVLVPSMEHMWYSTQTPIFL